jgi:hypothetical protein
MRRLPPCVLGLALLVWLALPIAAELRPPFEWEIPAGTVLNADPEPPWPMVLHDGMAAGLLEVPSPDHAALLAEPTNAGSERVTADRPTPVAAPARSSPLLILHQRRNE